MKYGMGKSFLKFGVLCQLLDLLDSHSTVISPSVSRYLGTNMVVVSVIDKNATVITEKLDHRDAVAFAVFVKTPWKADDRRPGVSRGSGRSTQIDPSKSCPTSIKENTNPKHPGAYVDARLSNLLLPSQRSLQT